MKYFVRSMRPEQWIKNAAIFAGLIFSGNLTHFGMVVRSCAAFLLFSFVTGAIYIVNDICDREADKAHEKKKMRPIASGKLDPRLALSGACALSLIAIIASFFLHALFGLIVLAYFIVNILYSLILKKIVIIDVLTISLDFVFRVLAGVLVLSVEPTPWIIITTIFLALFLALCKRRQEVVLLGDDAIRHREILIHYPLPFLDQLISLSAVSVIFSYILFAGISGKNIYLMYSVPLVLYGVMRYLYLVYVEKRLYSPTEAVLRDRPLQLCIVVWVLAVAYILYT